MELPVYDLQIDPAVAEDGVSYVALVDVPAILKNWVAFSDQRPKIRFEATDKEQRIISGPLMVAGLPIYRKDDKHGEHYVVFTAETIKQIVLKFFRDGNTSNVNLMHESKAQPAGVYMCESFLIDRTRGVNPPTGFDDLTDGSWFGSYKVDNDTIWNEFITTGIFKGFSVEGLFLYSQPVEQAGPYERAMRELEKVINEIMPD